MVQALFGLVNVVLPSQIGYYFGLFFSYARLGDGIFPMSDILLALGTVLAVWVALYVVKIVLWGLKIIPFIGRLDGILPSHTTVTHTLTQATNTTTIGDDNIPHSSTQTIKGYRTLATDKKRRWMI